MRYLDNVHLILMMWLAMFTSHKFEGNGGGRAGIYKKHSGRLCDTEITRRVWQHFYDDQVVNIFQEYKAMCPQFV